jgi:PAS domain S-box-containing protein
MANEKQISVLLIEDTPTDALLIQELLHNAPHERFRVITAPTLALGLDTLSHGGVDVVLLDLGLPDSQGLDTVRAVREHASHLPVVVLTVADDEGLGRKAVQEGAQRYVIKDVLALDESHAGLFTRILRYAIEHKRTQAELKAGEEDFKALFEQSPVAKIRYDVEGYPTQLNKAAIALIGIPDVAPIQHIGLFSTPRISDADKQRLRDGKATRYEQEYDFDEIRKGGHFATSRSGTRHVNAHVTPLYSEDGAVKEYIGQFVDITERKRAEAELENIAKFPEENPHPILRLAPEGRILYANAASEMFVRDWGSARSRPCDQVRSRAADAYRTGKISTLDVTLGTLTFQLTLVPLAEEGYVNIYGTDITARKHAEESLKRIEWLLTQRFTPTSRDAERRPYGDLTALNRSGVLLDAVGAELLASISSEYLDLLDSSSAIYERNGEYALGIFSSGWCQFLDAASRELCDTSDNDAALASGQWHCHESCWNDASKRAIETGGPVDVPCRGGIRLYAVPVRAGSKIIGAINFGYGDPPQDEATLRELAKRYAVPIDELRRLAAAHALRPPYIIDLAKRRLQTAATLIGSLVKQKQAKDALQEAHEQVQSLNEELRSTNHELRVANETLEERVKQRTEKLASLVEQLQRHKTMVDLASEGIIIFDMDDHITYWNHGAERLYGWGADEVHGMKIHSFLQTESPALLEEIRRTLFEKGAWHGELTHVTKRGARIVVESYQTLQRDAAQNPAAVFEINTGITDRKQAEERLRAASLYARSLIEASLDPLVTISVDGKITDVNRATEDVTGRSREELIGSDFSDYFTEPNKAKAGYKQVLTDGFVRDYPLAIRHASGNITDVLYNATLFKNEQGEIQGVFAAARDITDRKQAEEQLRSTSLYTRSLIEASLDPLVTISAHGKITDVNNATEQATGHSREELIGSDFSDYFTEPAAAKAGYKRVFTYGYVRDYPLDIRHKSGSIRHVLYNASVFRNDSGEIQGVFAAARDITEQKQAQGALMEAHEEVRSLNEALQSTNEELMRHSQHLEELIAERTSQLRDAERLAGIGETAAMIGHDLRNPLQGLQYIVDLQKLRFERLPPAKRSTDDWEKEAQLFDRISEQIFYMDKIVADLQDYARPIALEPEMVAVSAVINDVLASLPHTDHVKVVSDVNDFKVMADPHLMHRVFANLVLNAIQAMPDGGTLTISASRLDDSVAINVHDTGVGIPEEMRDKLFLPLSTGKAKGTGLGLAVVKRAVDAHRGTITFESGAGKGTTFTVTLPTRSG